MADALKIAILGDYNFTYNTHHATNMAIDHSKNLLEIDANYYWVRTQEAASFKEDDFTIYDGFWVAPGPFENEFMLHGVIRKLLSLKIPTFITGDAYKTFIEVLISFYNLNPNNEKLISDNLSQNNQFEKIEVHPYSSELKKMYMSQSRIELTCARYALYPQLLTHLTNEWIDIEAYNQYEDPEIISLKNHPFCVASMSKPQICSTREMPHPLISSFLNISERLSQSNNKSKTA
jgi:CTP synthase (UTP-ammonia lyase)